MAAIELFSTPLYSDANLLAYWRMESVASSGDIGSFTLTNNNVVTFTAGQFNNAGTFVAAASQRLTNTSTSLDISSPVTVNAWFKLTSTGTKRCIVTDIADNGSVDPAYMIRTTAADKLEALTWSAGTGDVSLTGTTTLSSGVWYMATYVIASSTSRILYLNGSSENSSSSALTVPGNTNKHGLCIGAYDFFGGIIDYWNGQIDDVSVFNRALTSTEVSNLYNGTFTSIKTVNGITKASVKTVDAVAIASVKTFNGVA